MKGSPRERLAAAQEYISGSPRVTMDAMAKVIINAIREAQTINYTGLSWEQIETLVRADLYRMGDGRL